VRDGLVYRWSGYVETEVARSLLLYVEKHAERLRRKYLAWIHELGETRIAGRRLVEHLELEPGFSYWWMTLLVEKSPWKTPSISDAIRLLALEELVAEHEPRLLRSVTANEGLQDAVATLCRNLGIAHESHEPAVARRRIKASDVYHALPYPLKALVTLARHLAGRWQLKKADGHGWLHGPGARLLCSYFIHVDAQSCDRGHFYTRLWEGLPDLLQQEGCATNWLQHYMPSSAVPDTGVALQWVRAFNAGAPAKTFHSFLDSYLCVRSVLRAVKRWLAVCRIGRRLGDLRAAFQPPGSQLSLWPVMRDAWVDSLCGPAAIINLLWLELFDVALRTVPRQALGLYVCEGQGWERAFIYAWRKHGHGKLIASVHATVRFWDLRYFADPRTVRSSDPCRMPQPDVAALNGQAAVDAFLSVDYPREALAECEAVRFAYLEKLRPAHAHEQPGTGRTRVLILGDVMAASTKNLLRQMEAAAARVTAPLTFAVKPHPNCRVDPADYPGLRLELLMSPLAEILSDFDIACASNSTSAGVDAYLAGLRVIVMLEPAELNVSPLRGQPGVRFAGAAEDLTAALQALLAEPPAAIECSDFFFFDSHLPRWRRLLHAEEPCLAG